MKQIITVCKNKYYATILVVAIWYGIIIGILGIRFRKANPPEQ